MQALYTCGIQQQKGQIGSKSRHLIDLSEIELNTMLLVFLHCFTRTINYLSVLLRCFTLEPQDFDDIYSFFTITMTINMFITGGRAGQVVFFVMLSILIFQILDKQRIKSLITIFIVIPSIFFLQVLLLDVVDKLILKFSGFA